MTMTAVVARAAQSLCSAQGGKSDKQASRVIELFGARTKPDSLNGLCHGGWSFSPGLGVVLKLLALGQLHRGEGEGKTGWLSCYADTQTEVPLHSCFFGHSQFKQ